MMNPIVSPLNGIAIRVGLVGTGLTAKVHSTGYTLLPAYYPESPVRAVKAAVCDVDLARAKAGARTLGWNDALSRYDAGSAESGSPVDVNVK